MIHATFSDTETIQVIEEAADSGAYACIRGVKIFLNALTSPKLKDPIYLTELREKIKTAQPFPYLVVQDWFNPVLLELVRDEFTQVSRAEWKTEFNQHARVERSRTDMVMGPASQLYFSVLNSREFIAVLSYVTGVSDLLPDPTLVGGGLHETLAGGRFGIHTDFDRHPRNGLHNEMVFITYLNHDWHPAWNGALELWDAKQVQCCEKVEPEFGRSIIMTHGKTHFHGHSNPLTPPPGITRKSVAAYYYTNRLALRDSTTAPMESTFLFASKSERAKALAKRWLPPAIVAPMKKLTHKIKSTRIALLG
jgi:2OG-Fe(II) oxygenase superfamily